MRFWQTRFRSLLLVPSLDFADDHFAPVRSRGCLRVAAIRKGLTSSALARPIGRPLAVFEFVRPLDLIGMPSARISDAARPGFCDERCVLPNLGSASRVKSITNVLELVDVAEVPTVDVAPDNVPTPIGRKSYLATERGSLFASRKLSALPGEPFVQATDRLGTEWALGEIGYDIPMPSQTTRFQRLSSVGAVRFELTSSSPPD
jgi:hypothetical protein